MEPIDWRELYAYNRAVIEGAGVPGGAGPLGAGTLDLPGLPAGAASPVAGTASPVAGIAAGIPARRPEHAGGSWERFEHTGRGVFVYTPARVADAAAVPLVVALHGCTQTAQSFSSGSLLNRAADAHGFVVAYPEQSREHNQMVCWNWFSTANHSRQGTEPTFIAGATRALVADGAGPRIDPARVFLCGMSAGGAMASVMAATHPDLYGAVAIHSGLAYGIAKTMPAATTAMRNGAADPEELGRAAVRAMGARARAVPALVIHGTADTTVAPVNAEHAARQWLVTNALAGGTGGGTDFGRPAATEAVAARSGGRPATRRTWADGSGRALVELLEVEGMGHAWSGGAAGGSYTDPRGPSATEAIWEFFLRA